MLSTKSTSPKTSPSTSPRRIRRPSVSNPITWLSRHSPSNSTSSGHFRTDSISSPLYISEPTLVQDVYGSPSVKSFSPVRYGILGSGATVVRTPQDALSRMSNYPPVEVPGTVKDDDNSSSYDEDEPPSPPLPPIPFASKSSLMLSELGEIVVDRSRTPSPAHNKSLSTRAIPGTPITTTRPVLKSRPTSPASLPAVPVLPLNISPAPPQPAFSPILLSSPPNTLLDLSTLMVGLETSSSSLRTTYATLTSRPSHLAEYLESLARAVHDQGQCQALMDDDQTTTEETEISDEGHQLASPDTPFASAFSSHLASIGLVPQSASLLNIFLDRPSAPYPHILTYLRQPTTSPATLPRAVALGPSRHTPERLEALLELRDEAKYLGLEELYKLCCNELRQRTNGHARHGSAQEDVRGRTPLNAVPRMKEPLPPVSTMTAAAALRTSNASSMEAVAMARSQTPASRRSETRSSEGWI